MKYNSLRYSKVSYNNTLDFNHLTIEDKIKEAWAQIEDLQDTINNSSFIVSVDLMDIDPKKELLLKIEAAIALLSEVIGDEDMEDWVMTDPEHIINSYEVYKKGRYLKEGDVYSFKFKEEPFYPYHCFDGQLILMRDANGDLYFEDTYYSPELLPAPRRFSISEIYGKGELKFKCNLYDVEEINEEDLKYYDDEDIFDLSCQHGHFRHFYKKKEAKVSKKKMEEFLKREIKENESKIVCYRDRLANLKGKLTKVEKGNTDIII